jgi:hypothetical protein
MVIIASWKMDADILENAVVAVVNVVDGGGREREGWRKGGDHMYAVTAVLPLRQFQ